MRSMGFKAATFGGPGYKIVPDVEVGEVVAGGPHLSGGRRRSGRRQPPCRLPAPGPGSPSI